LLARNLSGTLLRARCLCGDAASMSAEMVQHSALELIVALPVIVVMAIGSAFQSYIVGPMLLAGTVLAREARPSVIRGGVS
jgi:hypothetical protein